MRHFSLFNSIERIKIFNSGKNCKTFSGYRLVKDHQKKGKPISAMVWARITHFYLSLLHFVPKNYKNVRSKYAD